jgi:hypothetical protein
LLAPEAETVPAGRSGPLSAIDGGGEIPAWAIKEVAAIVIAVSNSSVLFMSISSLTAWDIL